jgi:hypothetical protein
MVRGGYNYDGITTESALSGIRNHAPRLAKEGKPWFLAVNLANPHDVMFVNTDAAGSNLQDSIKPMLGHAHPPKMRSISRGGIACRWLRRAIRLMTSRAGRPRTACSMRR